MKTIPLHPEHRDPSHSDGRVDLGLEETQNIDYRDLKFDIISQLPFASVKYDKDGIYRPTLVNKSILGDYYLSRGVSYQDLTSTPASSGGELQEKKEDLHEWLQALQGGDYDYVPFDAFYQISKDITNSMGLLLSKGINITVDFLDRQGEITSFYDTSQESGEYFNIYFRVLDNLGNSVYSEGDPEMINSKFSFKLSFNDEEVSYENDSISFANGIFTMRLKLSSLEKSGKLTLSLTYLYYGIIRNVSCYVKIPQYTLLFLNSNSSEILNVVSTDEEENITFNCSNCNFYQQPNPSAITYYLNFAIISKGKSLEITQVSPQVLTIVNDPTQVKGFLIEQRLAIYNTLGADQENPLLGLEVEVTSGDKTFNIIINE